MIEEAEIAVAVLAGGEGSRIGGEKPLIRLGETTLVERAFDRARGWSKQAVVIVRTVGQLGALDLPVTTDVPDIEGPLAGLAAGLQWARQQEAKALLSLPCDMPNLPDDMASRLARAIGGCAAALASSGGILHPVCGLWRVEAMEMMNNYCSTGQRSLRGFAENIGFTEVSWATEQVDPFFNINTGADLEMAEVMLRG